MEDYIYWWCWVVINLVSVRFVLVWKRKIYVNKVDECIVDIVIEY